MRAILAFLLVCAVPISPADADGTSVGHGDGGYIPDFLSMVRRYNTDGAPFRIEGVCKSACTMFLRIRNVCVERSATLMFHAGHDIAENVTGPNTRASRTLLRHYKPDLRAYLLQGHYMDSETYHTIPGTVLIDRFGYKECAAP